MKQYYLSTLFLLLAVVAFGQTKNEQSKTGISSSIPMATQPDEFTEQNGETIQSAIDAGQIPVQGRLTDSGTPVNGSREFIFTINIDSVTTWTETHPSVSVVNGFYSIALGSINPIPAELFQGDDSREVQISVDGTALSPITIYSPFGTDVGRFYIKDATDSIYTALSAINEGPGTGGTEGTRRGIYAAARGPGSNVGVFAYSENFRNINGQTELTDPEAYTSGQLSSLYGDSNVGGRALQAQYTATGPGHGIGLSGYAGGEGMNWGIWGRANAFSDSMQVGGYLEAFGPGAGDQYGVWGQASGENSSRNIGVYGTAFGSPNENWAGLFDGNVQINGDLELNGSFNNFSESDSYTLTGGISEWKTFDSGFGLSAQINFAGGIQGDSTLLPGGASMGNKGWEEINPRNGYVHVNDSSGSNVVKIEAVTDSTNTYGFVEINGQDGKRLEAKSSSLKLLNGEGILKADLNIFDQNDAGSVVFYGNNDTRTVILGSTGATGGETGFLGLYDTNDQNKLSLRIDTLEGGGQDYGRISLWNSDYSKEILLDGSKGFISAEEIELLNDDDSISVRINKTANYEGNVGVFDSLGVNKGFFRGENNGGYIQLQQFDASGNFQSAVTTGAANSNSFLRLYGQNTPQDNVSLMIDNYITDRSIGNGPVMGGNYRRSGTDWNDSNGQTLAAIGNAQDSAGAPGASGYLSLWGTSSFNVELTGKRWENNDLPVFSLYGQNDDGGGWYMKNMETTVIQGPGTSNYTNFSLFTTDNGGVTNEAAFLTSNWNNSKAGALVLRDSLGNQSIELNGENGVGVFANAAIGQPGSGGFVHLYGDDTTGIDNLRTQLEVRPDGFGSSYGALELRGSNFNSNILLDGSNGSITLNNNTSGFQTIFLDGVSGDISANNIFGNLQTPDGNDFFLRYGDATPFVSATPSNGRFIVNNPAGGQAVRLFSGGFDGNFGRFRLYGNDNETHFESGVRDDNTGYTEFYGADNVTPNITVSIGSKPGFVESGEILLNDNGTTRIRLDGQSGEIFADTIDAININYTGSLNGPSDKRLKKNIENLNGALFNITRLNGVSFNWNATAKNEMGIVDEKQQIGVIAQELEKVYPQLVKTNEEGFKTVNYVSLTAVLLEAIKELNNKVSTLEAENEDLKAQLTKTGSEEIDKLKDEIAEIKALISSSSNLGK